MLGAGYFITPLKNYPLPLIHKLNILLFFLLRFIFNTIGVNDSLVCQSSDSHRVVMENVFAQLGVRGMFLQFNIFYEFQVDYYDWHHK